MWYVTIWPFLVWKFRNLSYDWVKNKNIEQNLPKTKISSSNYIEQCYHQIEIMLAPIVIGCVRACLHAQKKWMRASKAETAVFLRSERGCGTVISFANPLSPSRSRLRGGQLHPRSGESWAAAPSSRHFFASSALFLLFAPFRQRWYRIHRWNNPTPRHRWRLKKEWSIDWIDNNNPGRTNRCVPHGSQC